VHGVHRQLVEAQLGALPVLGVDELDEGLVEELVHRSPEHAGEPLVDAREAAVHVHDGQPGGRRREGELVDVLRPVMVSSFGDAVDGRVTTDAQLA
jgi:hypothetical protein